MRRFLVLRATRWLPTGLLLPVLVLLLVDRGFTLAQIGLAVAAQGLVVFVLELPTGGLADTLGRRPVLLMAAAAEIASVSLFLIAQTMPVLVGVFVLQGVYRALESGPLDAWFVDAAREVEPDVDIERALARGGFVVGIAVAAGAVISGALVALDPFADVGPLALPVVVAIVLRVVDLGAIALLMQEDRAGGRHRGIRGSLSDTARIITDSVGFVRASRVLTALIAVEFVWGFGMVTFETLAPPKLAEVTDGPDSAAALLGVTVTAAWMVSALGAALGPRLARRLTTPVAAMVLHATQAGMVIAMAAAAGPAGVIIFYVATLGIHGAANPLYQSLLHAQTDAAHRTTVISAASMAAHPGGAVGGIALGALAEQASVSTAMVVGALVLLMTIPLYIPARRQIHRSQVDASRE